MTYMDVSFEPSARFLTAHFCRTGLTAECAGRRLCRVRSSPPRALFLDLMGFAEALFNCFFLECEIQPLKLVCLGSSGGVIFAFVRLAPGLQLPCTWGAFLDVWLSPKQGSMWTLLTAVTSLINSIDQSCCAGINDSG